MARTLHNEHGKLSSLARRSAIVSFFFWLADGFSRLVDGSLISRIMTGYGAVQGAFERGFVRFVGGIVPSHYRLRVKQGINGLCERSLVLSLYREGVGRLMATPVRGLGIGAFSFAFYSAVIYLLQCFVFRSAQFAPLQLALLLALAVVAAWMCAVTGALGEVLLGSWICSGVLFGVFGARRGSMEPVGNRLSYVMLYAVGMGLGVLTLAVQPLYIIAGLVALVALLMLIRYPEVGVYGIILLMPFMPTMAMAGFVIVTAVCYFLKFVRGKRALRFEVLDLFVALFIVCVALAGVISVGHSASLKHAALFCCFIGGYFIIANLIQSRDMIWRCCYALITSSGIVALYGVFQYFGGGASSIWQDTSMFSDIQGRVISTFDNPNVLGEYLLLAIPITISCMFLARGWKRFYCLCALGAQLACLVFTWSRGAWLGLLISVALLALMYNWRFISLFFAGLVSLPVLPMVLPKNIVERFTSIGDVKDSSTSYRVSIWTASTKMLRDFFESGVGMGTAAYVQVYPQYTLAGIESAPHSHNLFLQIGIETGLVGLVIFVGLVFLLFQQSLSFISKGDKGLKMLSAAGICSLTGILAQGMTDYIWYNYRVFAMFWIIVALVAAINRRDVMTEQASREFMWSHD